jgi:hypothetical protein
MCKSNGASFPVPAGGLVSTINHTQRSLYRPHSPYSSSPFYFSSPALLRSSIPYICRHLSLHTYLHNCSFHYITDTNVFLIHFSLFFPFSRFHILQPHPFLLWLVTCNTINQYLRIMPLTTHSHSTTSTARDTKQVNHVLASGQHILWAAEHNLKTVGHIAGYEHGNKQTSSFKKAA